jgi:hypothetical protein
MFFGYLLELCAERNRGDFCLKFWWILLGIVNLNKQALDFRHLIFFAICYSKQGWVVGIILEVLFPWDFVCIAPFTLPLATILG